MLRAEKHVIKNRMISRAMRRRFTEDEEYLRRELENNLSRELCLELTVEQMTGKLVNES